MRMLKSLFIITVLLAGFIAYPAEASNRELACSATGAAAGSLFSIPYKDQDPKVAFQEEPPGCYEVACFSNSECRYACGGPAICIIDSWSWYGYCIEL